MFVIKTSWASIIDSNLGLYIVFAVFALQVGLCFASLLGAKLRGIKFIPVTLFLLGLSLIMIVMIGVGFGGSAFLDVVPRFIVLFALYFARFIAHIALADVAAWLVFLIYWKIRGSYEKKRIDGEYKSEENSDDLYDRQ